MPRDYARRSTRKKTRSGRGGTRSHDRVKPRMRMAPLLYVIVGIGLSYAYQHPRQVQSLMVMAFDQIDHQIHARGPDVGAKGGEINKVASNAVKKMKSTKHVDKKIVAEKSKPELEFYEILKQSITTKLSKVTQKNESFELQIGSYMTKVSCQNLKGHLEAEDFSAHIDYFTKNDKNYCRVMIGSFDSLKAAYQAKNQLYDLGFIGVLRKSMS